MNAWQARAAQSKLNVTSRKMVHYCIPAAQLYVCEVTRPSFSRRLKGVACETSAAYAGARESPRARTLSHDFTMATHSEHAHYITKWRIRHAQLSMRRTHPLLRNCQDNAKLTCHCTVRY